MMRRDQTARTLAIIGAWAILGAAPASSLAAQPHPEGAKSHGQSLAQRHCGGCHAVASGPSPLADAPPFPQLFHRYRPGRLDAVLAEGMLAPRQPPEEGSPAGHPRMPMAQLDDDEVADLKAYLRSLDPRRPAGVCARPRGCRPAPSSRH